MTDEFAPARENMIEQQIRPGVLDPRVLDVFRQCRGTNSRRRYRSVA